MLYHLLHRLKLLKIVFGFLIFITNIIISIYAQQSTPSVNIPLHHFIYEYFDRLETKGLIPTSIVLRNRPYSRNDALKIMLSLDSLLKEQPDLFSRTDKELFEKLKGEFHVELDRLQKPYRDEEKEKHLIFWQSHRDDRYTYALGDVILDQNFEIIRYNGREDSMNQTISNTAVHGIAKGVLKDGIAYYADFTSTMIKGSDIKYSNFQPTSQGIINKASNVYSLEANAYLVIEPKYFRLQFGKDKLVLGPGKHSNLMLSDNAPAFDNLRLDVTFDRIKYTYFHGFLRHPRTIFSDRTDSSDRKYIAGHRLELKIFPWLFFAGNESVIYGGRSLETQYLNPIMIYHIAEQYAGDKDNNTMSFDVTAFPTKGLKTYASLFLDDYRLADNPFTYWKQSWAFLWGWYWVEPFKISNLDFRFEYSRVEPFVYTHKFKLINYTHFQKSLGSFLQPNSDDYFFELRYQPSRRLQINSTFELLRHGDGDWDISGEWMGYGQPGKEKKKFLSGVNAIKRMVSLAGRYETFPNHYLYAHYTLSGITNFQNQKGRNLTQHYAVVGYRLDY